MALTINSVLSAFLPYIGRQAAPALRHTIGFSTQYRTSDVAENLGRYVSCMKRTAQGKDFELILTVKMKTRYPVEGQFGSEFQAICNHCRVVATLSCKTWKFCEQFFRFSINMTPYSKVFKILYRNFSPPHQSTLLCSNVVKICPTGNG